MGTNSTSILQNKQIKAAQKKVNQATDNYKSSQFTVSDNTTNYQNRLNALGEYQSQYGDKIQNTLGNIEKGYDMNSDKLYQQYKEQYTREGLNASRDISGQVASLNGGADSSMGRRQAAQAYYNYMQALNDKVPELANQWRQDQYNYLSALQSLDESDYNKYADNRDYYKDMFQWSYNNDVTMYQLEQEKLYNLLTQADTNFSNVMTLEQFQAQMDQDAKQFGMEYALKKAESQANVANTNANTANIKANTRNTNANTANIKANTRNTNASTENIKAETAAIYASLKNGSNGSTTSRTKTTSKSTSSNSTNNSSGNKASDRYLTLASKITSFVDSGKTDDFKSKVNKAYKNGKISTDEKDRLLSSLNQAIALKKRSSKSSSSGYKDAKAYIDEINVINKTSGYGSKKQFAVKEIETRYIQGKITKNEYDKLIKYIDKNIK